jgi:hypothetical protein
VSEPLRLMQRQQAFPDPLMRCGCVGSPWDGVIVMVDCEQQHDLASGGRIFFVTNGPQLCQDDGAWVLWFARPSFAGLAVAEDSSVRPGWQQMAWAGACLQRFITGSSALARRKQGNVSRDLQS